MAYRENIAIAVVILAASYYVFTKTVRYLQISAFCKRHDCKQPPIIDGSGIIGFRIARNIQKALKEKRLLEALTTAYITTSTTYSVSLLNQTYIMTIEPENIKAILSTKFEDFGLAERELFVSLLPGGIFVAEGAHWQHSRALIRPAFTRSQVADLQSFETHMQKLLAKIPTDGTTVDLKPLFQRLTLDQATEFLLGESVNSLDSAEGSPAQIFGDAFDYALSRLGTWRTCGLGSYLYPDRRFFACCKTAHAFVDTFVQKALAYKHAHPVEKASDPTETEMEAGRYVFLNELARATADPNEIRNEILNVLLAGRDTTASMLISTFHVLSHRPDVWRKLAAEVAPLHGVAPDYDTLKNMKYLKYVMNEVLRLYPAVAANARQAKRDTFIPLGGGPDGKSPVFVPKGQSVGYHVFSMHRLHPVYGDDAYEFRPERWEALRVGWEYLPFNGGPRICVGQQFALAEFGYTVVRIVQRFGGIEARDERPWQEAEGLTTTNVNGAKVAFRA